MSTLHVRNPRTGECDTQIEATQPDAVAAEAAGLREEQPQWATDLQHRLNTLSRWAQEIASAREPLAQALVHDTGRRSVSYLEVDSMVARINYWVECAPRLLKSQPEQTSSCAANINYQLEHVPYAVVGIISPWNFPLILSLVDAIPALCAGSAVLLKPSEVTPRFAIVLQQTIARVPELAAVLRIVVGDGATGVALIDEVDMVCFTGSVNTGRKVAVQAAQNFIPVCLELGGKDPAIVLADADLDRTADAILRSAASSNGQACMSLERVFAHRSIFDELVEKLTRRAKQLRFNSPDIRSGELPPFIFGEQAKKVGLQLQDALDKGATLHSGGMPERCGGGSWQHLTILTGATNDMLVMREETFGPLLPILPFDTDEQALAMANDSEFGLSGSVFGEEEHAISLARHLEVGAVGINDASMTALVHDVEKQSFKYSGIGPSRMGDQGLLRFLRTRAIMIQRGVPASMAVFDEALAP